MIKEKNYVAQVANGSIAKGQDLSDIKNIRKFFATNPANTVLVSGKCVFEDGESTNLQVSYTGIKKSALTDGVNFIQSLYVSNNSKKIGESVVLEPNSEVEFVSTLKYTKEHHSDTFKGWYWSTGLLRDEDSQRFDEAFTRGDIVKLVRSYGNHYFKRPNEVILTNVSEDNKSQLIEVLDKIGYKIE